MKIYHYHRATSEFLGEGQASPDPKQIGKFLIPAYATAEEPPTVEESQVAVFDSGAKAWTVEEDNRGKEFWNKQTKDKVIIDYLGAVKNRDELTTQEPTAYSKWGDRTWEFDRELWLDQEVRPKRDELLKEVLNQIDKYRNQKELVALGELETTDISEEEYKNLLQKAQQLRDLPETISCENPIFPTI